MPIGAIIIYVRSTIFELYAHFSDALCFYYTITTHVYQLAVNFDGGNMFHLLKPHYTETFFVGRSSINIAAVQRLTY